LLYGRPGESLVVTWAVSLIVSQGTLIILGPSLPCIPTPFGSFILGTKTFSTYRIVLMAASVLSLLAVHFLLKRTRFGLHARATMQNPEIARAIGIDNAKIYRWTFALGSALAGVTGALYAPTMSIVPTMGGSFIVQAFVTVVTGGGNLLYGTLPAASGLGFIQTVLTAAFGNLLGVLGLLAAVIVSAGVLPNGLAYYLSGKRVS
jgi:branched-subunit amino acid ABC-type transport system permease component